MEYRNIKDKKVSLLGMGCMRLPLLDGSQIIDEEKTAEMVKLALDNGINYFDTAYPYHNGMSEIVIGKILKNYPRDSFFLASKMPSWNLKDEFDAMKIFNEQLTKCQVEYFDFYLCHAMNFEHHKTYQKLGVYKVLDQLRKEGKIKHLGFSFHDTVKNLLPILDELNWDFVQIQLNYLDYDMQDAKNQYAEITKRGIAIVVMEPVRGGMLANVKKEAEIVLKKTLPDASIASWALRYVASFSNVKVILSGMSNREQLLDNLKTFNHYDAMNEEQMSALMDAKNIILGSDFIPCTGCKYCMPCPFGVNIPLIFNLYNNIYGIRENIADFKKKINELDSQIRPTNCRQCGKCASKCPQQIKIHQQLTKISSLLEG